SSTDNGATWTNVGGATVSGTNSFYQLTEADEGKLIRAQASFIDDTGQMVTTTSAATSAVADVTPLITAPFSYAVDELSIVKNGTQIYDNTFSQAPPFSSTILSNGVATPITFLTAGSTWTDIGGKAILSSTGVSAAGSNTQVLARLNTNTDP